MRWALGCPPRRALVITQEGESKAQEILAGSVTWTWFRSLMGRNQGQPEAPPPLARAEPRPVRDRG